VKRYGDLWDQVVAWDNLLQAARKARRGKRDRAAVQRFHFCLEPGLLRLQDELQSGRYRPGRFHTHWITRPKPRLISAAPYRDRVVHHALIGVLEPILERHFHPDSYACRKGKGTHAAMDRLQRLMRRRCFALQCDVRKFFPSVDHAILKTIFRRLIKDRRVLALLDLFVDFSNQQEPVLEWFDGDDLFTPLQRRKGIPIGNLTSQWFANWYLTGLDHFITSHLRFGAFVRYCDDFILLHDDREILKEAIPKLEAFLSAHRLRLHPQKLAVVPVRAGLRFIGYRVWPAHRVLPKENVRRFRRRIGWMKRAFSKGEIKWPDIRLRLDSWLGHARQADSWCLLQRLSRDWVFHRGGAVHEPRVARRFLEQQRQELPICQSQQEPATEPE